MGHDDREPDTPADPRDDRRRGDDYDRPDYERPHRGGMILAFGIISLVMFQCFGVVGLIFGILAWVFANSDLRGMDEGEVDPSGRQMTQVGKILGIVGMALSVLYMLAMIAYLIFIFAFVAMAPAPAPPAAAPPPPIQAPGP